MLLTYHIMQKVPYKAVEKELQIEQHTACDWFQFCREVVLDFIEMKSEMIEGEGRVLKSMKVNSEKEIMSLCERPGAHTNTIESTWKQVKVLLSPYNRKADEVYILGEYMFRQRCKAEDVEPFCKFQEES